MTAGLEIRAEIDNATAKGLLLTNGGAAVALVAFLPSIIDKVGYELFVLGILISLLLFQAGLVTGVIHNKLRRDCSLRWESNGYKRPPEKEMGPCHWSKRFLWASVVLFCVAGINIFAFGIVTLYGVPVLVENGPAFAQGRLFALGGLVMNIIGVMIVWRFGFPQPPFQEYVAISVKDATPMSDGRTAKDHSDDARRQKQKYKTRSNIGMGLILLGFALQAVGIFN